MNLNKKKICLGLIVVAITGQSFANTVTLNLRPHSKPLFITYNIIGTKKGSKLKVLSTGSIFLDSKTTASFSTKKNNFSSW